MCAESVYTIDCVCGRHIETTKTTLTCPQCGRAIEIRWPAEQDEEAAEDRVIPKAA